MHRPYNALTSINSSWELEENRISMTLVDILRGRASQCGGQTAFTFLEGDAVGESLTYGDLDRSARAIAVGLCKRFPTASRIALVFPPGLDFIKAFFGCIYAGMVPVPATYPKPRRPSARLSAILRDAQPAAILAPRRVIDSVADASVSQIPSDLWLDLHLLEQTENSHWELPDIDPDAVAFLQYTSGSTNDPRGVMVTSRNISANLEMIRQGFALNTNEPNIGISWLPAYHDMGLIGGILESIYVGGTTMLMSPLSFLQRPMRWLKTISRYGAMISGGPNFAFELCVRRFSPDDLVDVDLSSWRVAFSGAEPIRAGTIERFTATFAPYGFSADAFYPCYGLAEATLLATGGRGPSRIKTRTFLARKLRDIGRAHLVDVNAPGPSAATTELVSCGGQVLDEEVRIVNPETLQTCAGGQIGEIWIRGRNVAAGYWNRPMESDKTFRCVSKDAPGVAFLRTGDLGFLFEDELYVTGRLKQLLIIRGKNHYPHDIEATAQLSHEKLIPGGGAALLTEQGGEQRLVIIQEVERTASADQYDLMIEEIRRRITEEHELFVHEVVLIRTNSLPRTTSGKVRYTDALARFTNDDLKVLARWSASVPESPGTDLCIDTEPENVCQSDSLTSLIELQKNDDDPVSLGEEIQARLMAWISQVTNTPTDELSASRPLAEYGLDSVTAMEMIDQLETGTGLKLEPAIAWTYPTPALLSGHLASLMIQSTNDLSSQTPASVEEADRNDFADLLSQIEQLPEDELAKLLASEDYAEKLE